MTDDPMPVMLGMEDDMDDEATMADDVERTARLLERHSAGHMIEGARMLRALSARLAEAEAQTKKLGDMYHKRGNDLAEARHKLKKAEREREFLIMQKGAEEVARAIRGDDT